LELDQAAAVFFVGKKDGTGRLCQDYRYLNEGTIKDAYPLSRIDELMDKIRSWKYFTKINLWAGYNNIQIKESDRAKAAFITRWGLFQPKVMFFGLCNSPATFQHFMNDIFVSMIQTDKGFVYMDDFITGGEIKEEDEK
jgi:hypothetical protein